MINLLKELWREWMQSPDRNRPPDDQTRSGHKSSRMTGISHFLTYWLPTHNHWGFAWISSIAGCLCLLAATGFGLWFFYSPSATSAWESVYFIENHVGMGHWIRGVHYLTADVLILMLVGYLVYQIATKSYLRNGGLWFFLTLGLLGCVMFNSLNGLLLPWDQQGYWSTRIRMDITSSLPVLGPYLAKILAGSDPMGHLSLTRSSVFHMGLIPPALVAIFCGLAGLHAVNRSSAQQKQSTSPGQPVSATLSSLIFKTGIFWFGTLLAIALMGVFHMGFGGEDQWGAPHLKAPADPSSDYPIARPEWYFLWLFQMLKFFPGESMVIGTAFIPGLLTAFIVFMPLTGRSRWGHRINGVLGLLVMSVIGALSAKAFLTDLWDEKYRIDRDRAMALGKRAVVLSGNGIPVQGALALLKQDPWSQGPELFAKHCASCHRHQGHDGLNNIPSEDPSAPDLFHFASIGWLTGLLTPDQIDSPAYFGGTAFKNGKMSKFVHEELINLGPEKQLALKELIQALSAQAALPYQPNISLHSSDPEMAASIQRGQDHLVDTFGCVDCHVFQLPHEDATAVDLTGYGSRDWLIQFISNPGHPKFYGSKNDRMPAFLEEKSLTIDQIQLVVDWLRN